MELTHFNEQGRARMVDVSEKPQTYRTARATATVCMAKETMSLPEPLLTTVSVVVSPEVLSTAVSVLTSAFFAAALAVTLGLGASFSMVRSRSSPVT